MAIETDEKAVVQETVVKEKTRETKVRIVKS